MKVRTKKVEKKMETLKLSKGIRKILKNGNEPVVSVIDAPEYGMMVVSVRESNIDSTNADESFKSDEMYYKAIQMLSGNPYGTDLIIKGYEEKIKKLMEENKGLKEELKSSKKKNKEYKSRINKGYGSGIADLVKENKSLTQKNEEGSAEKINKLEEELNNKEKELEKTTLQIHDLIRENQTLRFETSCINSACETIEKLDDAFVDLIDKATDIEKIETNGKDAPFGLIEYDDKLFIKVRGTNKKGFTIYKVDDISVTLFDYVRQCKHIKSYQEIDCVAIRFMEPKLNKEDSLDSID